MFPSHYRKDTDMSRMRKDQTGKVSLQKKLIRLFFTASAIPILFICLVIIKNLKFIQPFSFYLRMK